jgi:hypothetical protein
MRDTPRHAPDGFSARARVDASENSANAAHCGQCNREAAIVRASLGSAVRLARQTHRRACPLSPERVVSRA